MVSSAVSFVRSSRTLFDRCYKQLQINVGKVSDYNHVVATAFTTIFAVSQVEDVKHSYTSRAHSIVHYPLLLTPILSTNVANNASTP